MNEPIRAATLRTTIATAWLAAAGVLAASSCGHREVGKAEPAESTGRPTDETTEQGGRATEDAVILAKVKEALAGQATLPAPNVDAEVREGIVTLRGVVPSDQAKRDAQSAAEGVAGVLRVENLLQVRS